MVAEAKFNDKQRIRCKAGSELGFRITCEFLFNGTPSNKHEGENIKLIPDRV